MAKLIDVTSALRAAFAAAYEANDANIRESRVIYVEPFCKAVEARLSPEVISKLDNGEIQRFVYRRLFVII